MRKLYLIPVVLLLSSFLPILDLIPAHASVQATGGTITYDGDYKIHTFTSSDTFTVTNGGDVEYLVIGGGGGGAGGAASIGGGAGAGAFRNGTGHAVTVQAYTITIGAGGTGGGGNSDGVVGGDSTFDSITSAGGGYGGKQSGIGGSSDGSGGGVGWASTNFGTGGAYGNDGGCGHSSCGGSSSGGAGGGAGGVGGNAAGINGGVGGSGSWTSISGISLCYAAGGGGGAYSGGVGGTASCGGGAGAANTNAAAGDANTGSAGGGAGGVGTYNGGTGGSGIIVIKYLEAPTPDAVDDLSSPAQSYGTIELLWAEPGLNTGNVSGYKIWYTTPFGNPTTVITEDTGNSDTFASITGLTIGTDYTFMVSVITEGGTNSTHPPATWLNVTTAGDFALGSITFNQTNTEVLPITFEEQLINSTAKFLNVTYTNTYDMSCDFNYKFANTNQTYSSLTGTPVSSTLDESYFIFEGFDNEIIDVYCWDVTSGTDGTYLLTQTDFPLLQQITSFRAGEYGTDGSFGVFDFVTLIVVIMSMIGLNRVNESVGAVFNISLLGGLAFFGIIELSTVIFGIIALVMVFIITSTRKT
jgi:hypothetical protein